MASSPYLGFATAVQNAIAVQLIVQALSDVSLVAFRKIDSGRHLNQGSEFVSELVHVECCFATID